MMKKIRVLIVDDSRLIREMLTEILAADAEIEVVGAASDPYEAREMIKQLNPDVMTLDIEMPKMDGLAFLEKVMTLRPMPVVMVSTLTQRGAGITLRALEMGAVEYVGKPVVSGHIQSLELIADELVNKVKMAARVRVKAKMAVSTPKLLSHKPSVHSARRLIAIGASTGGVQALYEIITALPKSCPPIVITQHMPPYFTASFAERLNKGSDMTVCEASHDQAIRPGNVYIAPGGYHLEVRKGTLGYRCFVYDGPTESGHRPSVDILLRSVAKEAGAAAVGVILTGMGRDGAAGLLAMREAGAVTIGQNEETSVVYGMPKVAKQMQAVQIELPLGLIAQEILKQANTKIEGTL